jgi:hypothetical protein
MKASAFILERLGPIPKGEFQTNYTTTIGETIYAPKDFWDWSFEQAQDTLVHEFVHVNQYRRDGLTFMFRYVTNPGWRARYEAEAYATNLAANWRRGEYTISALDYAELLTFYGCSPKQIKIAETLILAQAKILTGVR